MSAQNKTAPLPFVVLASGEGTNAEALFQYARANPALVKPLALISDRGSARALDVAKKFDVPGIVIDHRDERGLLGALEELKPAWACLAGYRRIVGKKFLDFFRDSELGLARVINVHPSLLPAYPGLHGYERALKDGLSTTGVTVHFVDEGLDTGPTIFQAPVRIESGDTAESLAARARPVEHSLFTRALDAAARGELRITEQRGKRIVSTGRAS